MLRSVLAVILGYAVMAGGVIAVFAASGQSPDQKITTGFMAALTGVGFGFAVLGGYVAGWVAGRSPVKHGAALAVVCGVLWAVSFAGVLAVAYEHVVWWFEAAKLVTGVGGALLGGWLREVQVTRRHA
jgi:hypothetical protein